MLNILLVDDDPDSLRLMTETLPGTVAGATIRWEQCGSFEEALQLITDRRFDVVVTDVYNDVAGPKEPMGGDPHGVAILERIRERRFCPVLLITSGSFPPDCQEGPFVQMADKSAPDNEPIVAKLGNLIRTGVPELAHRLHDELDSTAGSYLWHFLDENWAELEVSGLTQPDVLDRLVHRRAAVQLGRLDVSAAERQRVEGAEFYLRPRIANELRLGQILRRDGEYRVVLTPHCHLVVQVGQEAPKADFVLTVRTVSAAEVFANLPALEGSTEQKRLESLRRRIQSPTQIGKPEGRYWFLPGFLSMPHLYVDLLQVESMPIHAATNDWETFAVLDVPFAEALQSTFVRFYSSVGLPGLDPGRFADLMAPPPGPG